MGTRQRIKVEPGFNRYDIDLPPGVIKVTIIPPPQLTAAYRILCSVERQAPSQNPRESRQLRRSEMLRGLKLLWSWL
jgi:hypothetical protein